MLKLSEAASLAMHATAYLAGHQDQRRSIKEIAGSLNASEHHLSKVFQRLAAVGLVRSTRGPKGGFLLSKAPDKITLLEVYEAIQGKFSASHCLLMSVFAGEITVFWEICSKP